MTSVRKPFRSSRVELAPALLNHPTFPVAKGLTGAAIQQKESGGRRRRPENDPRYLTAFASTLSEIIVPVLSPGGESVIGTAWTSKANAANTHFPRATSKSSSSALKQLVDH